jgi:hypothetical protein
MSESAAQTADMQTDFEKVKAVKRAHENELMTKANVVGVGVGLSQKGGVRTKALALVVMVSQKVPKSQLAPEDVIPAQIEGVPVDVQEVGEIKAQ